MAPLSPYGLRHSPPLVTLVHSRHGAFVPAIRPKGSYSSCYHLDGKTQTLPMPGLINLRTHPQEPVRRRAWEAEQQEWRKVREPLAACLNGIKGSSNVLNRRRGRSDCLHAPTDLVRIDRLETFGGFSPRLRALAERAFQKQWIDAEPRKGKSGGGYCSGVPSLKESRILVNFDGSMELVSTVAHELGHAFHNECAYAAGKTELQQMTPMTLAETASIMCESIMYAALLARARGPQEQLAVLETELVNDSQVIVDIYSRYLFEKEVMERREKAELSAEELCDIMDRAQAAAYGEGLDGKFRHPYMWTWKPHYYGTGLDFYNFPYAFGLLFSTGLYAVYKARGPGFVPDYESLLASTGEATAADLAGRFGIDIRSRAFWDDSLAVIRGSIDRYCAL